MIALLVSCAITGPAEASGPVPYTDPAVVGSLGLCDSQGHQVSSGSTATQPFVATAVSSVAAPSGYGGAGRGAVLYAFQPIENVPANAWSGEEITGNSHYSNPAHPMTAATGGDPALQNFVSDYPPKWDGLVQLRLYSTAPGKTIDSTSYAALDIKITGATWQAVDGGSVACTAGRAVSVETKLLPKAALRAPSQPPAASARDSSAPSGERTDWLVAVLGALAALAAAGYARWRARRPKGIAPDTDHDLRPALQSTSEKGR